MQGWVKLHKTLKDWEWRSDPMTLAVFINLMLDANFSESNWRGQKLLPGELIFGRKEFSKKTGISEQSVRTALEHLKSTNEITIKSNNKYSVISINNWSKYQDTNQQTNQQLTNNQPATNHTIRNKEYKNIYTSNESFIFSYFGDLKEDNEKIVAIAKEFDIRPKDVVFCIRDMLSKSSEKEIEIKNVKAKLNTWINNSIRWHKVATLTAKEQSQKPVKKYKSIDDYWLQEEGIRIIQGRKEHDPKNQS